MITQAEVVEWLPQWMRGDFNCVRGPHEWLATDEVGPVIQRGDGSAYAMIVYAFCKHCSKRRRTRCPDIVDRDPLEVINALRLSR